MLKVGMPGHIGSIELQDLIFTNRGPTAGLVAVEWNVRAETPGSAGIWGESSTRQGVGRIGHRDHKRRKNLVTLCMLRQAFRLFCFATLSLGGQLF